MYNLRKRNSNPIEIDFGSASEAEDETDPPNYYLGERDSDYDENKDKEEDEEEDDDDRQEVTKIYDASKRKKKPVNNTKWHESSSNVFEDLDYTFKAPEIDYSQ